MKSDIPFKLGQFVVIPQQNSVNILTENGDEPKVDRAGQNDDQKVLLQPKFIDVLCELAKHYPDLVSRQYLIDKLWDGNYPVGEKALTNAIWNLRQQFKENEHNYIETVRKRGYKLTVEPQYQQLETVPPMVFDGQTVDSQALHSQSLAGLSLAGRTTASGQNNPLPSDWRSRLKRLRHWQNWSKTTLTVALILLMVAFVVGRLSTKQVNLANISIANETTDPGKELFPVVSPDGQQLLYVWQRIGQPADLYLRDLSRPDKSPKQLTFTDKNPTRPIWSKNGHYIYFVEKSWDYKQCHIVKLTVATEQIHTITKCPANVNISLALSDDGQTLGFIGSDPQHKNPGIYFFDLSRPDIGPWRFSCGDECDYLDRNFAFKPNGFSIAVSRRKESLNEDIYLLDLQNSTSYQLTSNQGDILGMTWHPDGNRLVYASEKADSREGFVIDTSNGDISPLHVPGFSFPSFIPNSNELVYHDWPTNKYIAFLSLKNTGAIAPFPLIQSEYSHRNPHYSPRTQQLVYISNESGHNEIWVSKTNGDGRRKLTDMKSNLWWPRWSHSGQQICFIGPRENGEGNNLYSLNINTGQVSQITSLFDEHQPPTWLYNDAGIIAAATHNKQTRLYRFHLDGSKPQLLLNQNVNFAIQQPDQSIWYTQSSNQGLWRFEPNSYEQTPAQILTTEQFSTNYNWTLTEQGLYFQQNQSNHQQINYYDFASKSITPLLKLPPDSLDGGGSITYLPSEQQIIFSLSPYPQVDIKRLKHPLLE